LGRHLNLTCFLFIENVLLFSDGSRRDVTQLKEILDNLYYSSIGIMVNMKNPQFPFIVYMREFTYIFPYNNSDYVFSLTLMTMEINDCMWLIENVEIHTHTYTLLFNRWL